MLKKIVSLILIFCFVSVLFCACQKEDVRKDSYFARLGTNQKCEFVEEYIKEQYNIEATIDNVEQRPNGPMGTEELYYAIAKYNGTERIYCWIDENGFIQDSKSINDLSNDIEQIFVEKTYNVIECYAVLCDATLQNPLKSTDWAAESIEEMLGTEDVVVSVRIFLKEDQRSDVDQALLNQIESEFDFAKGTCYFYFVQNPKDLDVEMKDLSNYDLSTDFGFES